MQHDDLVTELMDQNAELQAEADSQRIELAEKRNSPKKVGAPDGAGIGEVLEVGCPVFPVPTRFLNNLWELWEGRKCITSVKVRRERRIRR